ncbi:hypothetical protein [Kangsaoukella pontilimi]|nr:hypothetical protein [Kangsaoukella pontilimi]
MTTLMDAEHLDFDSALRAVAAMLKDAQSANLSVQDHLGQFLDRKIDAASLIQELQTLDRTAQVLADLAAICTHIADGLPADAMGQGVDLRRVVTLDTTRKALHSAQNGITVADDGEDLHLFG